MTRAIVSSVLLLALALYVVRVVTAWPLPSDDMFYIDAAFALQDGTYHQPIPEYPFHHYLRWGVVLPLAGVIGLLGMSQTVLGLHAVLWHTLLAALLFFLLRRLGAPTRHAAIGALAPVLVPPTILPPRILSEAPECAYLLGSCLLLLGARSTRRARPLLAGVMLAVAVNATMVTVFSAVVPPLAALLDRHLRSSSMREAWTEKPSIAEPSMLRVLLLYGVGAAATYAGIMLCEGLLFGNPLLQYDALTWWHFQFRGDAGWSWDWRDQAQFVFAFVLNLCRHQPWWLLFVSLSAVAFFLLPVAYWPDRSRRATASVWLLGLSAYAVLELFGPAVIDKQPVRYLAFPCLLVTAGALTVLVTLFADVRAHLAHLVVGGGVALAVVVLFVSNLRELDPNTATAHYHGACTIMFDDLTARPPRQGRGRVVVASEVPQVANLVWYGIACRVYSNYRLRNARYVDRDVDAGVLRAAWAAYYVAYQEPERLPSGIRWRRLDPKSHTEAGTPAVFVAEPDSATPPSR